MLAGRISPDRGSLMNGDTTWLAYFDKERTRQDARLRVLEYLNEEAPLVQMFDGSVVC